MCHAMKTPFLFCFLFLMALGFTSLEAQDDFSGQVTAARRQAIHDFPDLARSGSPINQRFLKEVKRLTEASDPLLQSPNWPLILAGRSAQDLGMPLPAAPAPPPSARAASVSQPKPSGLGHTALDDKPALNGKVNPNAPPFTADYYMYAPETWVGKHVTLAVAYLSPRNDADRSDGLQQFTASTWNNTGTNQDIGGRIVVLAKPEAAQKLATLCGTRLQFNGAGVRTMLIKGEFTVLEEAEKRTSAKKEYGVIVDK